MSRRRWTILISWFAAVLSVAGQSSDVTLCITSYQWSINSLGQTPCLVGAYLESACGTPTNVTLIPPGDHYLAPTLATADPCLCSSVTYSMISACAGCQNHTFIDWTTWRSNCINSWLTTFPKSIPNATLVPTWAYLNLSLTNNNFSALAAQQNISNTPVSISSSVTTTSTSVSTSSSISSSASSSTSSSISTPSASAISRKSQSNVGAIAGGVVGGLVFLACIGLARLWYVLRKRRIMNEKATAFSIEPLVPERSSMSQTTRSIQGPSPISQTTRSMQGPSPIFQTTRSVQGSSHFPQSKYTTDMNTFPGSPETVFTTISPSRRSLESEPLSVAQLGGGPSSQTHGFGRGQRGYSGMPEI